MKKAPNTFVRSFFVYEYLILCKFINLFFQPNLPAGLPDVQAELPDDPAERLDSPVGLPNDPAGRLNNPAVLPDVPAGRLNSPAELPDVPVGLREHRIFISLKKIGVVKLGVVSYNWFISVF